MSKKNNTHILGILYRRIQLDCFIIRLSSNYSLILNFDIPLLKGPQKSRKIKAKSVFKHFIF